jgi:anti-anti-sigma factor
MDIEVRTKGVVDIVICSGKMTMREGDIRLRETINELLDAGRRLFILNLLKVTFIDSAGLTEIIACYKRVRDHRGTIRVVLVHGSKVHDVLRITLLDRVFKVFNDEEEAIASFIGDPVSERVE